MFRDFRVFFGLFAVLSRRFFLGLSMVFEFSLRYFQGFFYGFSWVFYGFCVVVLFKQPKQTINGWCLAFPH